ncbi:MAG: hypothetical protein ACR2IQ_01085 [Minisyncoccia bacterium]
MNTKVFLSLILVLVVLGLSGAVISSKKSSGPGPLDQTATCIQNSGAKFFGAFWCPHCKDQKAMFGSSVKLLPYIECSKPDGSQNDLCKAENISGYPTWKFADGTVVTQVMTPEELAEKTQCTETLPKK